MSPNHCRRNGFECRTDVQRTNWNIFVGRGVEGPYGLNVQVLPSSSDNVDLCGSFEYAPILGLSAHAYPLLQ